MGDIKIDKNMISSAHINFLFWGRCQWKSISVVKEICKNDRCIGRNVISFEEDLNTLTKKADKEKVYKEFGKEYKFRKWFSD